MAVYDARPSAFTQMTTTAEWEALFSAAGGRDGIDLSAGNAMNPTLDTVGRNAVIDTGNVLIKGQLWRCDAAVNTPIPAASAQNRIDRLVLRLTRGASTSATVVQPVVITGTPSGTPVEPPLVQTTGGIYDMPVSRWTATSAGALTTLVDERVFNYDTWHDMRPLQNSFVGTNAGEWPPQYRLDVYSGLVDVQGCIQLPSSGSYGGITFYTFPSGSPYIPPQQVSWPVVQLGGTPATQTNAGFPRAYLSSTGQLQVNGISPSINSSLVRITGRYAPGNAVMQNYGFITV
jgi:hypothetical protein